MIYFNEHVASFAPHLRLRIYNTSANFSLFILQEKLRMKILTRLSKEGSSADEPLNIPLSDYSRYEINLQKSPNDLRSNYSDEGDSSSSSDDEGKDSLCDLEGPCCQALRVPPSSPVLSPEKKSKKKVTKNLQQKIFMSKMKILRLSSTYSQTNSKNKQRRRLISPAKRNKLLTRSVMDLPTTDPGSDFPDYYYTTEEECETDYDTEGNITKISISRSTKIMRGDLRKANSASATCDAMMPPELIITKASLLLNVKNMMKINWSFKYSHEDGAFSFERIVFKFHKINHFSPLLITIGFRWQSNAKPNRSAEWEQDHDWHKTTS